MLEIHLSNGTSNLNVTQAHRNIFMALKLIEPTVKFFTPGNVTIDSLDGFPSEKSEHTSIFTEVIQCYLESTLPSKSNHRASFPT